MQNTYTIEQQPGVNVVYNLTKQTKGKGIGRPILRGNFTDLVRDDLVKLIGGEDKIRPLLIKTLNTLAAESFNDAYDAEALTFDEKAWQDNILGITVSGETLGELEDRDSEISSEVMKLVEGDITDEVKAAIKVLKEESIKIKEAIAKKKEISERRLAARRVTEEAKKANGETVKA